MENTVDFVPKVYKRKDVQSVLDRAFREFGQIEEEQDSKTSIEQFFRSYEDLYYLIPATGSVNSHQYLVEKSSELYTPEQAAVDIQPLLDEISKEVDDFIEAEYDVVLGDREKELRELEEK